MDQYQKFIHVSRYARWNEETGRRETWEETVDRYINFMCDEQVPGKIDPDTRKELKDAIINLEVMPSMRCLMTAGPALARDNAAAFNCSALAIDCPEAFDEMMYLLMVGSGVGFSVERQFISRLPEIPARMSKSKTVIYVEDSRIGWANATRELVGMLYGGRIPTWDVSGVRPAGSRLKVFGGRASGPEPLVSLFQFLVTTFSNATGRKLNSLECHDICCKIAEVVVAGGIRRSACISLSGPSDDRMRYAKSGEWYNVAPWRVMANNSAMYTEKPDMGTWFREWQALMESKSGERGIVNREAIRKHLAKSGRRDTEHEFLVNPCVTADTLILVDEGGAVVEKPVSELIGVPFTAVIHGERHPCRTGFFLTGSKEVYRLVVTNFAGDRSLRATGNHKISTRGRGNRVEDVELDDLIIDKHSVVLSAGGKDCGPNSIEWDPVKDVATVYSVTPDGVHDVYDCTVEGIHHYVANGIVVHNCGEINLRPKQQCNLSEVVVRADDTVESLKRKIRLAAILGTLQATLTDFAYLSPKWKENADEEALLGVSLSGIMDNALLSGQTNRQELKDALLELRDYAIEVNKEWAEKIGINQATAVTTVKPSGTVSQLVNCASGLHPRFSKYYIRTVRQGIHDPVSKLLIDAGVPHELDSYNPAQYVFSFPVRSPEGCITVSDVPAIKQLNLWKMYRKYWCEHQPSITVYVKESEWMSVGAWVYDNFDIAGGLSFLPVSDHIYRQAPYQDIDEATYLEMLAAMPEIDWTRLSEYEKDDSAVTATREFACTGGACEI